MLSARARCWLGAWADGCGRHAPEVVLLALAAAIAVLTYAAGHLGFYTDTKDMLSEELPFRRVYEDYKRAFPAHVDTMVAVVDGANADLAEQASRALAARIADRGGLFKSVYLGRDEPFFRRHGLLYLSRTELQALGDRLAEVQPFLARLAADPSLRGLFGVLDDAVAEAGEGRALELGPVLDAVDGGLRATLDGRFHRLAWQALIGGEEPAPARRLIVLQPRLDYSGLTPAAGAMAAVRRAAESLELNPAHGVRVRLTGSVALAHEELSTVKAGAGRSGLLAAVMVGIVLVWGLGSWRMVAAALLALAAGLIYTAGFAALAIGHLNMISVAFAVLYVGLGVDAAIHLCLRCQALRDRGADARAARRLGAEAVGGALALCALTTAIGFFAFVPTDFSGVSELGLISGTGMFIGLAVTLTLLPALMRLLRAPAARVTAAGGPAPGSLARRPPQARRVLWAAALAAVAAAALLPGVRFDPDPMNLRDPQSESVATLRELARDGDASMWSIAALAEDAAAAGRLAEAIADLDPVGRAASVLDLVPEDQPQKLAIIEEIALLLGPDLEPFLALPPPAPAEQAAAIRRFRSRLAASDAVSHPSLLSSLAGVLARLEAGTIATGELEASLLGTLPAQIRNLRAALAAEPVALQELPAEIRARWIAPDGRARVWVEPEGELATAEALATFVRSVRTVAPAATGAAVITWEAGRAVVGAFFEAFGYALAAITLLLLALMRPARDALLVLIPLLLSGALTAAATVLLGMPFNFANVIALPLLLGIGVDGAIHMIHRARGSKLASGGLLGTSTARAILFSALTTACSFGNLAFSPHPGTASMGLLLTLGIAASLCCTLLLLPALLAAPPAWLRVAPVSAPPRDPAPALADADRDDRR